jgi:hypothetical protein
MMLFYSIGLVYISGAITIEKYSFRIFWKSVRMKALLLITVHMDRHVFTFKFWESIILEPTSTIRIPVLGFLLIFLSICLPAFVHRK